jgi:hypothetical protein
MRFVSQHRRRTQSRKRIEPARDGSVDHYDNGAVVVRSGRDRITFGETREAKIVSRACPDELCGRMVDRKSTLTISFDRTNEGFRIVSRKLHWLLNTVQWISRYGEVNAPHGECQFTLTPVAVNLCHRIIGELPKWVRVTESRQQVSTKTEYKLPPTKFNKSEKIPYKPVCTENAHSLDRESDYDA